ncbi:hypothetical protein RHGRI_033662 [Rhododendron griersonianum]|uniref:UDP-glucose/GDP-mannose dehydrogenase dimerisation domain-containing protein n=1 Tax=Rhododendron griersonianum TaxID=479676 RepID=A0AAV6I368_9ERIC|nr:hypothetical protein RHGRI_033662 [Rhododendron griersonianum]
MYSQGTAMNDLLNPTMEHISRRSPNANPTLAIALHEQDIGIPSAPTQVNNNSLSMELGLRARNVLFAMKVSFVNAVSSLAIKYNYPTNEVLQIAGLDPRILNFHLTLGIGFGGPNFKRDLDYLSYLAKQQGCQPQAQFFNQINVLNFTRMVGVATWIKEGMVAIRGRVIVVLGVSYKNGTGDIKESQAIEIWKQGAILRLFDPNAQKGAVRLALGARMGNQINWFQNFNEAEFGESTGKTIAWAC